MLAVECVAASVIQQRWDLTLGALGIATKTDVVLAKPAKVQTTTSPGMKIDGFDVQTTTTSPGAATDGPAAQSR